MNRVQEFASKNKVIVGAVGVVVLLVVLSSVLGSVYGQGCGNGEPTYAQDGLEFRTPPEMALGSDPVLMPTVNNRFVGTPEGGRPLVVDVPREIGVEMPGNVGGPHKFVAPEDGLSSKPSDYRGPYCGDRVVIWSDPNFQGESKVLTPGTYILEGLWNGKISSVQIPVGFSAVMNTHADFSGYQKEFKRSEKDLSRPFVDFNDTVSAIIIRELPGYQCEDPTYLAELAGRRRDSILGHIRMEQEAESALYGGDEVAYAVVREPVALGLVQAAVTVP